MNNKILLITDIYPYHGGEEFIESEINVWSDKNKPLIIAPVNSNEYVRETPKNINVINSLNGSKKRTLYFKVFFMLLNSGVFIEELKSCNNQKKLNIKNIFLILKDTYLIFYYYKILEGIVEDKKIETIYTYWNQKQTYASLLLKRKKKIKYVVSRCHRYDIYENEREGKYIPYKRVFKNDIDKLFTISLDQITYLQNTFGFTNEKLDLSRLGVECQHQLSLVSDLNCINILSVSYIRKVKNIKVIYEIAESLACNNLGYRIKWTHIGGAEKDFLKTYKIENLSKIKNLEINFLGKKTNSEIKDFYKKNQIDLFINSSISEGVPVSIMEAMSFGVPVYGSNVGSTKELLGPKVCKLIESYRNPNEYVLLIEKVLIGIVWSLLLSS